MLHTLKNTISACLKSQPRLHAQVALLRDQYKERRKPTPEGIARSAYFHSYFERANISPNQRRKLLLDFYRCRERFGSDVYDYVLYDFNNISDEEKSRFVTERKRHSYYRRLNRPENKSIFKNKDETYRQYGHFFLRELLHLHSAEDWPEFHAFCGRHDTFICKPRDASCGKNVQIHQANGDSQFREILLQYDGEAIVEELIQQAPEMAALHPESVNTVRITTLFFGEKPVIYHPFLRSGVGRSVVDNGGAGGILAALNPESGVVETNGRDENGVFYESHPDTGVTFRDFRIPRWPELLELTEQLCRVVPTNHYTGWDFALTPRGWVLVEANDRGQFVGFQMMTGKGCLQEFESILAANGV